MYNASGNPSVLGNKYILIVIDFIFFCMFLFFCYSYHFALFFFLFNLLGDALAILFGDNGLITGGPRG